MAASCAYGIFLLASAVMGFANTELMILSSMGSFLFQLAIRLAVSVLLIADGLFLLRATQTTHG
jgi:hypothetical protein